MLRLRIVLPRRGRWVVECQKSESLLGVDISISLKEYESRSFYGCYMTSCPWLRFGRKLKGLGREKPGAKSVRMVYFATEGVMGRVRKR